MSRWWHRWWSSTRPSSTALRSCPVVPAPSWWVARSAASGPARWRAARQKTTPPRSRGQRGARASLGGLPEVRLAQPTLHRADGVALSEVNDPAALQHIGAVGEVEGEHVLLDDEHRHARLAVGLADQIERG